MTPVEFTHAIKAADKAEENNYKTSMEAARIVASHVANFAGKSLKRPLDPKRLIPFTWDNEGKNKETQSPEEMKHTMMGIAKTQNKRVEKDRKDGIRKR